MFDGRLFRRHRLPKRTEAWTQGALVSAFLRTKTLYTRSHLCVNASARLREMSHARVLPNACLCLCEPRAPCRFTHIRVRAHACLRHKESSRGDRVQRLLQLLRLRAPSASCCGTRRARVRCRASVRILRFSARASARKCDAHGGQGPPSAQLVPN